jgi:hypothetical protein
MPDVPDPRTRERLLDGLGAGVAATLLMTGLLFAFPAFRSSSVPYSVTRLLRMLAENPAWLVIALGAHLAYGGLSGALYFGGARRVTVGGGALYGFGLWGVAMAIYAPLVGLGFVASQRPSLALLSLPAHLVYGMALAAFAPRGEIMQRLPDENEREAPPIDAQLAS